VPFRVSVSKSLLCLSLAESNIIELYSGKRPGGESALLSTDSESGLNGHPTNPRNPFHKSVDSNPFPGPLTLLSPL
jgi:hypothetical protein